jgi:3'(2'), 5'-bisphosphate nucleotidase
LPSDLTAIQSRQNKLLQNPAALCNMVKRIAREAGEITLKYYDGLEDMQVAIKHDDSPVTLADREAECFIQMSLEEIAPDIPMIGEEGVALGKAPKFGAEQEYFWLVDPIDGTKEFITGGTDFTVNIGLIRNGVPVLGVIYAPVLGELYSGYGAGTAKRFVEETGTDKEISVRPPPKSGLRVVASKSHGSAQKLDQFLESFKVEKKIKRGSTMKVAAIASGKADIYPRFGPTGQWDTAAADAILRAAGGTITDLDGKALFYGPTEDGKWLNPEFVACSFDWFDVEDDL